MPATTSERAGGISRSSRVPSPDRAAFASWEKAGNHWRSCPDLDVTDREGPDAPPGSRGSWAQATRRGHDLVDRKVVQAAGRRPERADRAADGCPLRGVRGAEEGQGPRPARGGEVGDTG